MKIGIPLSNIGGVIGFKEDIFRFAEEFGTPVGMWSGNESVDALLLPGGADVSSFRYNERPSSWASRPDNFLEDFDLNFLPGFIGKVPILGICRGLQTLNVHFGGTLNQHIKKHQYSVEDNELVHIVRIYKGEFKVNSYHHQGIKLMAPNFVCTALDDCDRVEAIQDDKNRIFAVQWHPERMYTPNDGYYDSWTMEMFNYFLGLK